MRPIPKRLLIHTATLYQRVNVDKWGKGELNGGQELSNIRIEPSKQIIRDKKAANGKFVMKWEEPYSQYLWNGKIMHGSPDTRSPADYYDDIKFTSDLARAEWAKYAREVYGEQWKQVYQAALKRRLK